MILVTGGFGLIGSNLVKRLSADGNKVLLVDKRIPQQSDFFSGSDNIYFESADVSNPLQLASLFANYKITAIVHAAANVNGVWCKKNPTDAIAVNTLGTMHLLELARVYSIEKFIYVGSGSVFGTQTTMDPILETTLATPMNTYASSKRMSEELVHCYRVNYGIKGVNIRVSWVFGPTPELREPRWSVGPIAYYSWKVLTEGKLIEPSGLDFMANFTSVDDVVEGICCVLKTENPPEYVHLSSEQVYKTREIVEFLMTKRPDCEIKIGDGMDPFVQQAPLRGPLVSIYKDEIGYRPTANLKDALEKYFDWMSDELKKKEKIHG